MDSWWLVCWLLLLPKVSVTLTSTNPTTTTALVQCTWAAFVLSPIFISISNCLNRVNLGWFCLNSMPSYIENTLTVLTQLRKKCHLGTYWLDPFCIYGSSDTSKHLTERQQEQLNWVSFHNKQTYKQFSHR